ncbi:MAG: hypothetical protein KDD50_05335, partial [Bdellovibrionales bacterium]|nr:hypothetical protein [Bdellovibrionales bacterium]
MNNLIALVNIAGLILIIENYLSYAWSVVGAFRKDQEQSKADYNLLKFSNITFWVLSLYIIAIRFETILPNLYMVFPFQALATLVFWKTTLFTKKNKLSLAFSKDLPEMIYKTGPYSFLRHPFYFSYLLCYTSVSLLLLNPLIFIS